MGEEQREVEASQEEYKSGFTLRSYLALVYAAVVFLPALIYAYLLTINILIISAASWATLILFVELAKLYGNPLTKQESIVILWGSGFVTTLFIPMVMLIYGLYFRHSPAAEAFGLVNLAPAWWAPSVTSPVWFGRVLLSAEWTVPIAIIVVTISLTVISNICLGLLGSQLFIKEEKLPFPGAVASASGCTTLVERDPERMRVLTLSTMISAFGALVIYGIPFISWAYGHAFQPVPIPWADFNYYIHLAVPGASFGIATDIFTIVTGFIVPFSVTICMLAGAFGFYFIGNAILVQYGITQFSAEWRPGMNIALSWQRSLLYAWLSPIVGIAAAAGIIPLLMRPGSIVRAVRGLRGASNGAGVRPWVLLVGFLGSTGGSALLVHYLIPDFPLAVLFLIIAGWSLAYFLIGTRAIGVTALSVDVPSVPGAQPYTPQLSPAYFFYVTSGYRGADVFFAPVAIDTSSGSPWWVSFFKLADAVKCSPTSIIKALLAALPLGVIMSLIYVANFWRIAPIPSTIYPGTLAYWPTFAVLQSMWASGTVSPFNPLWLLGAFAVTAGLVPVFRLTRLPISMIAVATGTISPFPVTFAIFIGGVIGKILQLIFGKEKWSKYSVIVWAGFGLGEGLVIAICAGIATILRGMWILPY